MFQCLSNSIEYTYNHPENSYKNADELNDRIDYILYKFNEKNLVSLFFISYLFVPMNMKISKINIVQKIKIIV